MTQKDFQERGYNDFSEILNDLPGMDISRLYCEFKVANYWRGYRTTFSQPYLFMIDGMTQNELYYNNIPVITSIPLSYINKVEIVYGPVSSVYGANAFMGVINIITKSSQNKNGISLYSTTSGNTDGYFIGDYSINIQKGKFFTRLATRFESGDLTDIVNYDDSHCTSSKLYTDTLLWGDIAKSLFPDGKIKSPQRNFTVDLRIGYNKTEFGFQLFNMSACWGTSIPADRVTLTPFDRNFYSIWLKQDFQLHKNINSRTFFRFHNEIWEKADWIEGYEVKNNDTISKVIDGETVLPNHTIRLVDYSLWPLYNSSFLFTQDFDFKFSEMLLFTAGIKFEQRHLTKQRGYYGTTHTPQNTNIDSPDFYPVNSNDILSVSNVFMWKDYGTYVQGKYFINENHILNAGFRIDNNSEYGTNTTFRGGYVARFGKIVTKILYGQAYQIPTPRTLYSAWTKLGASHNLEPEKSQTFELNINYSSKNFSSWVSAYYANNEKTIVNVVNTAKNLGERNVVGIDAHLNFSLPVDFVSKWQIWTYFSTYLLAEEQKFDNLTGQKIKKGIIGDLSNHKIYCGTTVYFTKNVMLNLRSRFIGERETIDLNPVRKIDSYFVCDGNIGYLGLISKKLDIMFKVQNIFDKKYFHPGIGTADAGNTEGRWENGEWFGSQGWQTSIMPQAHRFFIVSLVLNIENLE